MTEKEGVIAPQALKPGSRVRVVAPSGPFDAEEFQQGVLWLQQRYEVVLGASVHDRAGFFAGTEQRRAQDLTEALRDPACAAIVAARGGSGAIRVAQCVDFTLLRRAPKWLIGFSDFTAIHSQAWQHGVASLHAANVTSLGRNPVARARWIQAVETTSGTRRFAALTPVTAGRAEGFLVGGNLTVLAALAAAGALRLPSPAVLLLEDVGEAPYRLHRALDALWSSGLLDPVVGCVLGQFVNCGPGPYEVSAQQAVDTFLTRLRVPVLGNLPVGHGADLDPVTLGHWATVDCASRVLTLSATPPVTS